MTTFQVDNVRPELPDLSSSKKWHAHYLRQELARVGVKNIEAHKFNSAVSTYKLQRPEINSFLETCLLSYNEHVPLVLSPDDVWLTCVQAVSKHISLNPEEARKALVSFEGKKVLNVIADDFVKGSPDNDWHRVFGQFGNQMEKHLGKKRQLFDPTFSTTTPIEKAAIQVQMMAAMAPYFDYVVHTRCGIPNITLLGTNDDWDGLLGRVSAFGEFLPEWAHAPMMQVIKEFALAKNGAVNLEFWRNFAKENGGSGGPYVTGYINGLFPYLNEARPNHMLVDREGKPCFEKTMNERRVFGGANVGSFPGSVSSVPLLWKYLGQDIQMRLATGIFGTSIYGAGYRPLIGWALGESRNPMTEEEADKVREEAYKDNIEE